MSDLMACANMLHSLYIFTTCSNFIWPKKAENANFAGSKKNAGIQDYGSFHEPFKSNTRDNATKACTSLWIRKISD
jgi:hypothetical protein